MLQHKLRVKGIRVVEVQLGPLGGRHVMMGAIIIVVIDHCHLISEVFHQLAGDGGLSAARAACNANDNSEDIGARRLHAIFEQLLEDISFNAKYGFWGLVVLTNWQLIGYMMVIYIAGLQNIPTDVLEAASIDGSSPLRTLFKIKIPMVMPSITICMFLTLTNSFKMFDQNLALTNGAPGSDTEMLALNIYKTFYGRSGFQGVGQAKAVIFFILVAIIAFIQLKLTNRKEIEQ